MSLFIDRNERNFSLSHLLPYDIATKKNGQLKAALHEYRLLLIATEQAIDALEKGASERLDPIVGESMCQIRAIKIAIIAKALLMKVSMLKLSLKIVKEKIDALSDSKSILIAPKGSLKELFEKERLDVLLTNHEAFLVQSYLLTLVKVVNPPLNDRIEPRNLQKLDKVSRNFAEDLVKKLRRTLSLDSVEFIRECARELPEREELIPTTSEKLLIEHNGCYSLPFFFVNDILMRQALTSRIPIVVCLEQIAKDQDNKKIRQICLLFTQTLEGYQRKIVPLLDDLKLPAFVLRGFMQRPFEELPSRRKTICELSSCGIVDLILMNSANHRQCLDSSKDKLVETIGNQRLKFYKAAALEKGCSLENPSLFFINHVFCGSIGHQNLLRRKTDITMVLKHYLPMSIIETIIDYEEGV